ncbi:hypothetical protein OIU34_23550 [Pararhizobium sp. BT-229]|uniref:hypothetical protein n=1 Tax=Pararhizobium sp. BT-229 TaxID=2986923 RepID=UPI0021F70331|nr:hypothetical protein [Pararhizobium sp. BT-229]MCV9964872.1 hypothetical protein [Pararhizobium sp. BT-229]
MVYRWPEHDTFTAYFPDKTALIDVVDVVLEEVRRYRPTAQVRFTEERSADLCHLEVWEEGIEPLIEEMTFNFFESPHRKANEASGMKRCEGKLTEASRAGLDAALTFFGGQLTARGPRGANSTETNFPVTGNTRPLSPFFEGVRELCEFMPLHGAAEVMKSAEIPEERSRLLEIVENFAVASALKMSDNRGPGL